jgi:hypothetical protein
MKKLAFLLCIGAIIGSSAFGALTLEQLGRFQRLLCDAGQGVRMKALEDLQKAQRAGGGVAGSISACVALK